MKIMENLSMSPKIIKTALALSAIGILAATGGFVVLADQVDTTISIDVNPSIEITANKADEVIEVTALNEDAEIIIGDMDLDDVEVEVAMNAIIGSMVQNGYIDEMKNAVLITVANANESKQQELEALITTEITDALAENDIAPIVFTQAVDSKGASDTNVKAFAKKYGISVNKAAFIQKIMRESEGLSEKELVAMNVEALSEVIHSENATEKQTEATVRASEAQVRATEKQAEAEIKSAENQAEAAVKSEENRVQAAENQAVVEEKAAEQSAEVDAKAYEAQIQAAEKQREAEVKAAEQQAQAAEKQAEANAKVAEKQAEATAEANETQGQAIENQAQANGNGNAPGKKGGAAANQ